MVHTRPRLLTPQNRLILPGSPGWDEPVSFAPRRRKSAWWERLLSGRAATTRLAPGSCCGCGGGGVTCNGCTVTSLTVTITFGSSGLCQCSGQTNSVTLTDTWCTGVVFAGDLPCHSCGSPSCGTVIASCAGSGATQGWHVSIQIDCGNPSGCSYLRTQASSYTCSGGSLMAVWNDAGTICSNCYAKIVLTN